MASRRAEFIAARDLTPMWAEFEAAKAEWAVEQEAAKAADRERKSQRALKKREARHRKKEEDASVAAERSAEIQARWGVADKARKENDSAWPACPSGDNIFGIKAIKVLKQLGAYADAEKAKQSVGIRPGKGKMRNRRYINRKGPLIVYGTEGSKIVKAFRNLPGVDVANVERLNLLDLAPGGHLGRFVIWTESAFKKLDEVYGSFEASSSKKKGFVLPRPKMTNADLGRLINSDEVQSVVKPINKEVKRREARKNPLKNAAAVLKLNPYFGTARRMAVLAEAARVKARKEKINSKRTKLSAEEASKIKAAGKAWYQTMISDSDYTEFDVFSKWLGVSQ
uniref:Large ribosomal subunit protein uL4 C-terminal domain-containing protein n=1 Tax=Aegilops tauschii TaxID=37682 RepID=M8C641_AEGTA